MEAELNQLDRQKTVQKILVSVPEYIQKVKCDTEESTLPFKCAMESCSNVFLNFKERDKYPYKFHNFPAPDKLCKIWRRKCGLPEDADITLLKVCSDHFSLDDYVRNYKAEFTNPDFKRKLIPDAIPRRNLNSTETDADDDVSLSFNEIKDVVDEHEALEKKYQSLLKKKSEVEKKIFLYNMKIKQVVQEDENTKILQEGTTEPIYDESVIRSVFSEAQIKLLQGKEKVFWSDDDLAKAFTLRHIGSKECYLYLKNTLNMPLPALACVQKWAASGSSSS